LMGTGLVNDDCPHGPWVLDTAPCYCEPHGVMHIWCNDCGAVQINDEWQEHR
jgi:hypothetical protein